MTFPVKIHNVSNMIYYVGAIRFAPNEIREIHEGVYNTYKYDFDWGLQRGELKIATEEEMKKQEKKRAEEDAKAGRTIIERYKDNELHWKTAESEIRQITNTAVLRDLYHQGLELGLQRDNVIMERIVKHIEAIEFAQQ